MTEKEILETVTLIIEDLGCFDKGKVKPESDLREDLRLDSLDEIEVTMEIEKECRVSITDEESKGLKTVNDYCEIVKSKLQ